MKLYFLKNILPHNYYKYLSSENKIQFWVISTGCFVSVITFWFGIALQYLNVDYNRVQNERLGHIQLIDRLYPLYKEYNDSCRAIYEDKLKAIMKRRESSPHYIPQEWIENYPYILYASKKSVDLSSKAQYYFDEPTHDQITHNNIKILISLKSIELYRHRLNLFQYRDSLWSYILSNDFGFRTINTYGRGGNNYKAELDSSISRLWDVGNNMDSYNLPEYALIIFDTQIMVHLRKNAEIMSDELVHASFRESVSPIIYILISLLVIILLGVILWLIMINIVFDKSKNTLTDDEINDFNMVSLNIKLHKKELKKLDDEYKELDQLHLEESLLFEKKRETLIRIINGEL